MLAPGPRGIAAALRDAATPALELVIASVPLFIVAAAIESFLRQSSLSTAARFAGRRNRRRIDHRYVWYVRRLPRACPRLTSDGSSQKRGLTNCQVAIQHWRGDARGIEVERLRAEGRDPRQRRLALTREILQSRGAVQPFAA